METILVAEADMSEVRVIQWKYKLERHGYEVETASDGAQALEMIRARRPDLLIADVALPVISGFQLILNVRRDPSLMDLPVILLMDKAGTKEVESARRFGADSCLAKPVHWRKLNEIIERLLSSHDDYRDYGDGGSGVPAGAPVWPVPPARPTPDAKRLPWPEA